ncbi:MAG: hypothetical protein LBH51_08485 [Treponema sp.]|jgi:hypothetical protein|nr:hypothetical protein [Treponema sp.]
MSSLLPVRPAAVAAASAVLLLFSGCLSAAEGAGKFLERRFDRPARRYRSPQSVPRGRGYQVLERADGGGLDILIEAVPAVTLKASPPERGGAFSLRSLEYLGGNSLGWVEFSMALSGGGSFIPRGGGDFDLRLSLSPEPGPITGGEIKREGTRLFGEDALRALHNRYERIQALAEWMGGQDAPREAAGGLEDFDAYWKVLLLPELVPAKKRPPAYSAAPDGPWATAEQVRWHTAYTEGILPEELRPLRDSGTLKRDWEESRDWIFLVYAWDRIFSALEAPAAVLQRK